MRPSHGILTCGCLLLACGSRPPTAPVAAGAPAPTTRAAQCLQDSAAPRQPKPGAPDKIRVAHILVRHAGLERPQGATRSREEACLRALDAREALEKGGAWDEIVKKYGDAGQD